MNLAQAFYRLERKLKYIITVRGKKSFWCDSHPWLCIHCIRMRSFIKGINPFLPRTDYIALFTNKGIFVWKRSWNSPDYPLIRTGSHELIAKVFGFYEYLISSPCKIIIRSELPVLKADFVVKK